MVAEPLSESLKYPDSMVDDIIPLNFQIDFDRRLPPPVPADQGPQNEADPEADPEAENERLF